MRLHYFVIEEQIKGKEHEGISRKKKTSSKYTTIKKQKYCSMGSESKENL